MKNLLKIVAIFGLSACSGAWETGFDAPIDAEISRNWTVRSVSIDVPETLTTTEENSFTPDADIVWHGDPVGDRKTQIAAIMQAGIEAGAAPLDGRTPVELRVVVEEFHALTPKARATAPSAVHNISYTIQPFNKVTGEVLSLPQHIRADFEALTKEAAFDALATGQTQKVRIIDHLASVTAGWLGIGPDPRRIFSSAGR